ncbi:HTH-type transcriptional repressor CytR [Dyadobacter sp. CECT 9275]|uniref:HTH-type transcriptional repressor CytR n=1 Tax=Dyadobacter helix TaxID=2822344 RepID=A0A916JJZ0_9BACT|nr:LacI family DNA-binding transcriptional regulator [Dyadobacter sp. CECT 9275]CAG5012957.1 HTH-type transcriptional repressor CytR [Dyadobacter sp. CECT 9275]
MRGKQATIWDIAVKLNISISTVSRALRNAADINPETKKAVLKLASELDYQPNAIASSLRNSKTNIIGIIVPEFIHAYFPKVILGVQDVANQSGYKLMISQSGESLEIEKANIHAMVSSRVDGLIMALSRETDTYDHILSVQKRGIPVVFFNRFADELTGSKVLVDDYKGAFEAVDYLIRTGCRRIAHLAGPEKLTMSGNRIKGYLDALKAHNIPVLEELIIPCDFMEGKARQATQHLLNMKERPDAIFVVNDPTAIEALICLKENNVRIPDEISLICFSNAPHSTFVDPPLSAIVQPLFKIGQTAARLLIGQVEQGKNFIPSTEKLETELVIRKSTRPLF